MIKTTTSRLQRSNQLKIFEMIMYFTLKLNQLLDIEFESNAPQEFRSNRYIIIAETTFEGIWFFAVIS